MKQLLAGIALSLIILAVVVTILVSGVISPPTFNNVVTAEDLSVSEVNNGEISRTVHVSKGDTFAVVLYVLTGAGVGWSSTFDSGFIVEDRPLDYISDSPPGTFGDVGRVLWTFRAMERGETTIVFNYGSFVTEEIYNVFKLTVNII